MNKPAGYSVAAYGRMILCEPRMSSYAEALRDAITPGCRVIDIGAGSGIFSLLACQYGAGSVVAIEPDPSVELLRAAAKANGFEDRITIFEGLSTDYDGPKADVVISDLRGCLPLFEHHVASIVDARDRLLVPGGTLIPARDRLHVALVHDADLHRSCIEPWLHNAFGIDLSDGHRFAANQSFKTYLTPIELMSVPQEIALIDYTVITDPNLSVAFVLTPEGAGDAHGFLVWFDAELGPGIGFSNAPGEPEQVYGQTFFPFERPITLADGDRIAVKLRANLIDGSYIWSWTSKLQRSGASSPELTYRQSTFLSMILPPARLAERNSSFVPQQLSSQAVDRHCLSLIDGKTSLGDIAVAVRDAFPDRFANAAAALDHVSIVVGRYMDENSQSTSEFEGAVQ